MKAAVAHRRSSRQRLEKAYPGWNVIDVTSKGDMPWQKLSPFYPHGGIPVPMSPDIFGQSVEGIWQGLKVFENENIDLRKLDIVSMSGLKRTERAHGRCIGHRAGTTGSQLLGYVEARLRIYLPAYRWVLDNKAQHEVGQLRELALEKGVVLLDFETNADVNDISRPLSHASLIVDCITSTTIP